MNRAWAAVLAAAVAACGPARAQEAGPASPPEAVATAPLKIIYLSRENDPAYQPVAAEDGTFRPAVPEPSPGADLAIKDLRATAHAVGLAFALEKRVLAEDEPIDAAAKALATTDALGVVADLPIDDVTALARTAPPSLALFNIRHADDALRRDFCGAALFHVIPSTSMLTDALVQFTVQKNWRRVLVLSGPLPADRTLADAFTRSAKKFGARIVGTKPFVYGNDPRNREQTNIGLMTSGDDYDVVFIADTAADFGRFVPYALAKPRPVIGTEGLQASAWSPLSERFGSPQVNHRFLRLAHRDMGEGDWATWVAVRSVMEAAMHAATRDAVSVRVALAQDTVALDVSKGVQSSYRRWDHQLRQAVELHSADVVVDYAPFDGFLHQHSPLDTLGIDEPESPCRPK